jgi:hypothetical protein
MEPWQKVQEVIEPTPKMFQAIVGRALDRVEVSQDKEKITFHFQEGDPVSYATYGGCCSSTWIEHLEQPYNLTGAVIYGVKESSGPDVPESQGEVIQSYMTTFVTTKGNIDLEYRNSSNGYYGGSLEGPF